MSKEYRKTRLKLLIDEEEFYSLGGFIKQARLIMGHTRKELMPCINHSQQLLCQIEHDQYITHWDTYFALAEFYGIPEKVMARKVDEELEKTGKLKANRKPYLRRIKKCT